ncbi:hypothetical protein ACQPU1_16915 [Clostridium paraputrificum]|uniref:hypothetical protein n=1 Tax=Clostridium paraputrificum TaxID=29363 RepID=UPI003D33D720
MKRKISIIILLMMSLMIVGCGNSVVKKSIEQARTAIESKEYDKALASLQLALDEDKDNEEAKKLYSIVDTYQKAKKLVDENKITEAKEIIDGINSDYINYAIKEDIDSLKSQIDNYLKEVENITALLNEAENMFNNKQYAECKSHINDKILSLQYVTDEQKVRAEELIKKSDEAINEIEAQRIAEEKKKQEEAKKAEEEKKKQQSSVKRYYVPHLNKSLTMDEMFNEYNKSAIPFDYIGDDGNTYMFNPGSAKPTEPAY